MEDNEVKNMWKTYDTMIEQSKVLNLQSWALNLQCFENIQTQKAKSRLNSLIIPRLIWLTLGFLWIAFLGKILTLVLSQLIIAVSVFAIIAITIIAMIIYLQNIVFVAQINYSDNIIETQKKISLLQTSVVNGIRVGWLQLPFYVTCFIPNKMLINGNALYWTFNIFIFLLFTFMAIYLFKNLTIKNSYKKWVRNLMKGFGLVRISEAMNFIRDIEEFKKDLI